MNVTPATFRCAPGCTVFTLAWLSIASLNLVSAQITASERATLSQTVDGTVIDIQYSRPSLRGRKFVFSTEIVPDSVLWTPGADSATTFQFNRDVTIEGTPVPAGQYSVWMVTGDSGWEVVLDSAANRFHLPHPDRTPHQISFSVVPDTTAPQMESLLFYFPVVRSTGADLRMQWDRTMVQMEIVVEPSRILTVTEDGARPYVGRYAVDIPKSEWAPAHAFEMQLVFENDHLGGEQEFGPGEDPLDIYLAPAAEQTFNPVWVMNGTVAGVFDEILFEFTLDSTGHASSFEVRNEEDAVWMTGKRLHD